MNIGRKGFTLIEILIVVAIIAILASVVLVGLGPTQQAGRDARRLSDLREVQNGLELYYQQCGFYPGGASCAEGTTPSQWSTNGSAGLADILTGTVTGLGTIPNDPSSNRTYIYGTDSAETTYVIGAALENAGNSVFNSYTVPANLSQITTWVQDSVTVQPAQDCTSPPAQGGGRTYCIAL